MGRGRGWGPEQLLTLGGRGLPALCFVFWQVWGRLLLLFKDFFSSLLPPADNKLFLALTFS